MSPTDLMIGNLVYGINRRNEVHLPNDYPLRIMQIEIFNCEAVLYDQNPAQVRDWFRIANSDISPIPITPEWLERAGFQAIIKNIGFGYVDYILSASFKITYSNADEVYSFSAGMSFKYIHQLQNLYFALTQKELEFKKK